MLSGSIFIAKGVVGQHPLKNRQFDVDWYPEASQDASFSPLKLELLLTAKSVLHKKYNSIVVVNILLFKFLGLL